MSDVTITRHEGNGSGEYRAQVQDSPHIGRLTWVEHGGVRIADHTLVPPQIGGRGIAAKLVDALMEDARAHGFKVRPDCSYVAAKFNEHPEWADLRA